ncbi:hypothetical protein PAPYR_7506 [Paratrimastix pyriformis]|uniref:Uncharacterized protein n=1 Tax=Paratrimastix pyriformis TaxID=342808 RepID=A0ABQ8UGW5_9EUKA|nr:hypothetical protein PAPYR_7506 [Paratrimastix pyriformis]
MRYTSSRNAIHSLLLSLAILFFPGEEKSNFFERSHSSNHCQGTAKSSPSGQSTKLEQANLAQVVGRALWRSSVILWRSSLETGKFAWRTLAAEVENSGSVTQQQFAPAPKKTAVLSLQEAKQISDFNSARDPQELAERISYLLRSNKPPPPRANPLRSFFTRSPPSPEATPTTAQQQPSGQEKERKADSSPRSEYLYWKIVQARAVLKKAGLLAASPGETPPKGAGPTAT